MLPAVGLNKLLSALKSLSRDFPFSGGPAVKNPCSSAGDEGSIPGQGTKILRAVQHSQKRREKK